MNLTKRMLILAFAGAAVTSVGCAGVHSFDNRSMSDVDREARRVLTEDGYDVLNKQQYVADPRGFRADITHLAEKDGTLYKTQVTCEGRCYISDSTPLKAAKR